MRTDFLVYFSDNRSVKLNDSMKNIVSHAKREYPDLYGKRLAVKVYAIAAELVSEGYLVYKKDPEIRGGEREPRLVHEAQKRDPMSVTHRRIPQREIRTQHEQCWSHCLALTGKGKRPFYPTPVEETTEPTPEPTPVEPTPEPTPVEVKPENVYEEFYRELWRLRNFAANRNLDDKLDSMRPLINGVKSLKVGISIDSVLAMITATWSEDSKRQAINYPDTTPGNHDTELRAPFETFKDEAGEFEHATAPFFARLAEAGVFAYAHGPHGTGKSTVARQSADRLEREYHEVNLANEMVGAIKGRHTAGGYIPGALAEPYSSGGVLCLEEIDAAMPNVLTAINNAVANGEWTNDVEHKVYKRHELFWLCATGNTLGTGATKQYTGRNRLDAASLDRFFRVYVGLDIRLERNIFESMIKEEVK